MTAPLATFNLSATVSAVSGPIAVGDAVVPIAGAYYKATTANLATAAQRAHGIAVTAWSASTVGSVSVQHVGVIDSATTGLGAGAASWVRVSAAGRLERATVAGADDVVGYCAADGTLYACFGLFTAAIANGGGGTADVTLTGSVNIGDPGFESGSVAYVGATYPANFKVNAFGSAVVATAILHRHSTVDGCNVLFSRSKSDTSSHAAVASGDVISALIFAGHDGTDYNPAAQIVVRIAAATGANDMPGAIDFYTTPDGSNAPVLAMTIDQTQTLALAHPLPVASGGTGIASLGAGVATFLGTPSGANLGSALTSALAASKVVQATGTGIPHVVAGALSAASSLIVDADVNAAAAIAGTKVSPNFGAQNIVTTGFVSAGSGVSATGDIRLGGTGTLLPKIVWNDGATDNAMMTVDTVGNGCSFGYSACVQTALVGSTVVLNATGGAAFIYGGSVERLRVESLGVSLGGGAGDYGSGDKVIFIANATTVPTTNPTGGGILYVTGGALKYRGSAGTVTNIAPA